MKAPSVVSSSWLLACSFWAVLLVVPSDKNGMGLVQAVMKPNHRRGAGISLRPEQQQRQRRAMNNNSGGGEDKESTASAKNGSTKNSKGSTSELPVPVRY